MPRCKCCGSPFEQNQRTNRKQLFCAKKCQSKWFRDKGKSEQEQYSKRCKGCGAKITTIKCLACELTEGVLV